MRAKIVVPPADIERAYNDNIEQYSTPEQVRASHILLKTEGKDDAAVKAKAEELLKQAKSRRRLRGAREEVLGRRSAARRTAAISITSARAGWCRSSIRSAFAMQPGQISDLVKTQFGYHIIKLVDKKPATTRHARRGAAAARPISSPTSARRRRPPTSRRTLEKQIKKPADLDKVAKAQGLTVQESGFFARDEPILGARRRRRKRRARAFEMKDGEVAGPLRASRGFVFVTRRRQAGSRTCRSSTK